jgi:hypothetical protein
MEQVGGNAKCRKSPSLFIDLKMIQLLKGELWQYLFIER